MEDVEEHTHSAEEGEQRTSVPDHQGRQLWAYGVYVCTVLAVTIVNVYGVWCSREQAILYVCACVCVRACVCVCVYVGTYVCLYTCPPPLAPGVRPLSPLLQDYPLNPKSLSLGELYGEFDLSTSEWTDGVLSSVMRQTCSGR